MPTVMQWTNRLVEKIAAQKAYAAPFEQRYSNSRVLPFIAEEYRKVYGPRVDAMTQMIDPPKTGMAAITVDALTDRLRVEGCTSDSAEAAAAVEAAWEENDLDVMHREGHREGFIAGQALVQLDKASDGSRAVVGIESAEQMAVVRENHPPYDVIASMKITQDDWTGKSTGRMYLREEGKVRRLDLREGVETVQDPEGSGVSSRWTVTGEVEAPFAWVPVVELAPRPRLLADSTSEIEPIASLVDIADLIEGLMVFAGHFGAVPIRFGTGMDVIRDKDGNPVLKDGRPQIGFDHRADSMWVSTSKDAKFGQLEPASLASFVTWADHCAQRIRAKTSVASTYYSMDLKSHMTGELLKTDEAPMVRRVNSIGRDGSFGQAWRKVMRMILAIEKPELARVPVRPRWVNPETRIESIDADRFSKLVSHLGPQVLAEEVLGWSPDKAEKAVKEFEDLQRRRGQGDPAVMAALSSPLVLPDAA